MEKWLIYPYVTNYDWVFKHKNFWNQFDDLRGIVNEKIDENQMGNITDISEFENELKQVSGFWIVDSLQEIDFDENILPKIKLAVENGVKIFCTKKLPFAKEGVLRDIIPENQRIGQNVVHEIYTPTKTIFDIDVPVVYMIGMSEESNSVGLMLDLQRDIENKGYKVALFSDAKEVQLFKGGYWLSSFYERGLSQADRTIRANWDIKQVEINENPDLIIIGMMSGVSTLGRTYVEDFGINVYSMTRVVQPDCAILNVLCGDYSEETLRALGDEVKMIIGGEIDFYNIVNKMIDMGASELYQKVCTIEIDGNTVLDKVGMFQKEKFFFMTPNFESARMTDAIISKLEEYAEIISV